MVTLFLMVEKSKFFFNFIYSHTINKAYDNTIQTTTDYLMAWGSNFSVGVHSTPAAAAPPSTSWVAAASAASPAAAPVAVLVSPILSGVRVAAATQIVIAVFLVLHYKQIAEGVRL
jgi:hypothetical protein